MLRYFFCSRILKFLKITVVGVLALFGFLFSGIGDNVVFDSTPEEVRILESVPYKNGFCVIYDFWEASGKFKNGDYITLILHATPTYLNFLQEHLETWDGGISVSVFIPTPETKSDSVLDLEKKMIDFKSVQLHLQVCSIKTIFQFSKESMIFKKNESD